VGKASHRKREKTRTVEVGPEGAAIIVFDRNRIHVVFLSVI